MKKLKGIARRRKRIRKKIVGTKERPRLSIARSNQNLYTQLIDDLNGRTLLSLSTASPDVKKAVKYGGNVKAAKALGESLAKQAKEKGITKVVFDRSGRLYHGRIKALAEAARKGGLLF